ncbi:hypothetical protein AB7A01_001746 [Campylobacter coli]|uniref:hypothetical protein n=1 Tax=Campylobacter coli TaxID=195 RepID=UPI000699DF36|nr:hypothetical protein [Campylobacter coli]EAH7052159.1 hypothetical protein [Campylobacter coli]EAI6558718.1 hypothetical protein [Campylobacter coli]EAK1140384.1 hypothetical protein [Campylobacter coli]EAK4337860.1 hypothetical protein [Campylobacter coli]EAK7357397.1 hypothetical protein [Campylobacter coli]
MQRGEAKIEFYSNINYLKKEFENGCVVSKFLYDKALKEKNFNMTYKQFNKYFNDEFKNKIKRKETIQEDNQLQSLVPKNKEPIKVKIDTKSKKVFDAKFGKDIKEDDLL